MPAEKVNWGKNRKKDFIDFIFFDMKRVMDARTDLDKKYRDWEELYRAPQLRTIKSFPYEGASSRTYPFAMMSLNPVWANIMQTIHATPNIWTVTDLNEAWTDLAKPLQDYLQFLDKHILKMWEVNNAVFLEMLKLGTGIYKTYWKFRQNRSTGYDENFRKARLIRTINQPAVEHVPRPNFFLPPEAKEINPDVPGGAQWVAERIRIRPGVLRQVARGQSPVFPNWDRVAAEKIIKFQENAPTEHEQTVRDVSRISPSDTGTREEREIEIFEVHARFDTTGDGIEDDIVVTMHLDTGDMLQALYNPMPGGVRPYDAVRYLRTGGFDGIGICEQAEVWQDVVTELVNLSVDKATLTNAPMLAISEGANVLPNEPVYPTKVWSLANPKDDLVPLFLTDNRGNFDYQQLVSFFLESGNQHTGVSDLKRGSIDRLPSRTPATSVQSLLAESKTLFDLNLKDIRLAGLSAVGLKVLQLLQQHVANPSINAEAQGYLDLAVRTIGEKGQFVAQALQVPAADISTGVAVELTATTAANNKELLQTKFLGLLQLMGQLAPSFVQLMQVAEQSGGSATGLTALGAAQGMAELFSRLLEQHDIRDTDEIVPREGLDAIVQAQAQAPGQAGQGPPIGQPIPNLSAPFGS